MGVQSVLGGSVAWHVEYDRDPSRILAHHWPDVPNHGDVKHTDWASVEPVDILTAGYPCQPFSHAGKRKGADDPRHLWPDVARAIGALRPSLVVLENVRGHVSLGLADVLADLSGLGYDATWGVVRAADAGAPHGRARIFICATADARRERHGRGQDGRSVGRLDGADAGEARERERPRGVAVDRGAEATADAAGERRGEGWPESARLVGGSDASECHRPGCFRDATWVAPTGDDYGPAIRRWHDAFRCTPASVEPGRNGPRLSPRFVEWMQGLPAGHVTDVPDLSRNAQLKALGNGVVPQQAALAIWTLLAVAERAA